MMDNSETKDLAHLHGEGAKYSEKFQLHFEVVMKLGRIALGMLDSRE